MRRTTIIASGVALAAVAAGSVLVPVALAGGGDHDALDEVRSATRRYRKVDRAIDDGYVQFFGCVHEPLAGSMGIHFVNGTLAGDAVIDAATPEALMYDVKSNGRLELMGAEYVVFKDAWDAANSQPPELFGQTFNTVESPNRYGLPAFYELHAWAWTENPTGAHQDYNPQVVCAGAEGHTT
ncbi:MAG: hypothetical protein ACRDZZ_14885 [Ilumatobacteraceae bacterium]